MKGSDPSDFILFLHLQKTAGMTLQELLRKRYGPGLARRAMRKVLKRSPEGLTMKEAIRQLSPEDRIFMGHYCFGIHRFIGFNTAYITFLREPASRLISLYKFSKRTPGAHYYKVAFNMSCEEFLFESKLLEMDNGMTRFIAGDEDDLFINRTPYGKCSRELLDRALSNIDSYFSFVGIQEEFDRSVLLLSKVLNWSNPYYISLNVSRGPKDGNADEYESLRTRILESNPLDVALYDECKRRFTEAFNSRFPEAETALENFKEGNNRYQKWAYPLYQIRSGSAGFAKKVLKPARS